MPPKIPTGLTREHVLLAFQDLDQGFKHDFGEARGYHVVQEGRRYAPKAVVGIAFRHLSGEVLDHRLFSGGEGAGQANHVLRELGFTVLPIRATFITSCSGEVPPEETFVNFNMWQKRIWPYFEVRDGDVLYWYNPKSQKLVTKLGIMKIERHEYQTKAELRGWLVARFETDPEADRYYQDKPEKGYCLAYSLKKISDVSVPKPEGFSFPREGWLRGTDPDALRWLASENELQPFGTQLESEGYFNPTGEDQRKRVLREIVERRGQPEFRASLLVAYGSRCAVTGCNAVQALEAAHITPYLGGDTNHLTNGLLLRSDIHTLFDLHLLTVDAESMAIRLAETLLSTSYAELEGKQIDLPVVAEMRPSALALAEHNSRFAEKVEP